MTRICFKFHINLFPSRQQCWVIHLFQINIEREMPQGQENKLKTEIPLILLLFSSEIHEKRATKIFNSMCTCSAAKNEKINSKHGEKQSQRDTRKQKTWHDKKTGQRAQEQQIEKILIKYLSFSLQILSFFVDRFDLATASTCSNSSLVMSHYKQQKTKPRREGKNLCCAQ